MPNFIQFPNAYSPDQLRLYDDQYPNCRRIHIDLRFNTIKSSDEPVIDYSDLDRGEITLAITTLRDDPDCLLCLGWNGMTFGYPYCVFYLKAKEPIDPTPLLWTCGYCGAINESALGCRSCAAPRHKQKLYKP